MNSFQFAIRLTSVYKPTTLRRFQTSAPFLKMTNGDLNNTAAERARTELAVDPAYRSCSFAISQAEDDAEVRKNYRPFMLDEEISKSDWVSQLELSTTLKMVESQVLNNSQERLKVLVLHGSMRNR
jgi:arsenic resistance protein ArsH